MIGMAEKSQVLEFRLGSAAYCIDIDYIEEVVEFEKDRLTELPNTDPHIEGVLDLRGDTTTIVDPTKLFGVQTENGANRAIVLETDNENDKVAGWQIDEVKEGWTGSDEEVEQPVDQEKMVKGVINHGDEFVIWVEP